MAQLITVDSTVVRTVMVVKVSLDAGEELARPGRADATAARAATATMVYCILAKRFGLELLY